MTPEWLSAIVSAASFVVVAATAIAALVQLRHMRSSNQIAVMRDFWSTLDTDVFGEAARFTLNDLPQLMAQPEFRRHVTESVDLRSIPQLAKPRDVGNFFDYMGEFVKHGIVDADLACDMWGDMILRFWRVMAPLVANARAAHEQPGLWENFEYLAVLAQRFAERHAGGGYPKDVPRAEMPPLWKEALEGKRRT